ncbi:MAG: GerMN domain-containing protein [Defluviitaleaceae bacterium]|nr:GerMN domain-containing protein [Defluviitaleaceae bacterium]
MKRSTKQNIQVGIIVGSLLAVVFFATIYFFINNKDEELKIKVFYFNTQTNNLETEERPMPEGDTDFVVRTILGYLKDAPKNAALSKTLPDGLTLLEADLSAEAVLYLNFDESYSLIPPLEETIFRMSCIWTFTELPYVQYVYIHTDGNNLINARGNAAKPENRLTAKLNPEISPVKTSTRVLKLFYVNEQADGLLAEDRLVTYDIYSLEKDIVQLLIDGTRTEGRLSSIPPETRILDVKTENGICNVSLSGDFITRFTGGPSLARHTVYAIVNSLIENSSNVNRVQFLIDSERVEVFHGVADFDKVFDKDESLIIVPEEEIEDFFEEDDYPENFEEDT